MEENNKNIEATEETVDHVVPVASDETENGVEPQAEASNEALAVSDDAPEAVVTVSEPKKKRKKWSKKKIALFVVVGFILFLALAFGIYVLVGTLTRKDHDIKERTFSGSAPAHLANTITAENQTSLDAAIALSGKDASELTDADRATIKERIAYLYNLANYNKIHNTDQAIAFLQGDGGAALGSIVGKMFVRGFKVQAGEEYYYQKAAMIYECSESYMQSTLESILNQQERAYADQENNVYKLTDTLKGDDANIINKDEIEYVPFIEVDVPDTVQTTDKAGFYSVGYYVDDPREIQNFRIAAEHIILNENSANEKLRGKPFFEYVDDTEFGMGYYICRFSLDYLNDYCVDKSRAYLRASANSDNLEYAQYDVVLEVWENGYLKRMYDDEKWTGDIKKPKATTTSTSWYEITMFYSYDDSLKAYFDPSVVEKYDVENWAEKIIADYRKDLGVN